MDHLEFAKLESEALEPTAWDHWIKEAERLAKGHDIGRDETGYQGSRLDGDQEEDGFSMDGACDAFKAGLTTAGYLLTVQQELTQKRGSVECDVLRAA